jgi:hypothetical protein
MTVRSKKIVKESTAINIPAQSDQFEIVKIVVTTFIDFEKYEKGKGIEFKYQVETLSNGEKLYIHRPGRKWNFDFKVEIPVNCGLGEGKHNQIALLLRRLKEENEEEFNKLWGIITSLYTCSNNDVDCMLSQNPISYKDAFLIEILLKIIKWLFIMEDIVYWHYEGRAFLYNFFSYVINETDENRLRDTLSKMEKHKIKPDSIKNLLKKCGIKWIDPKVCSATSPNTT